MAQASVAGPREVWIEWEMNLPDGQRQFPPSSRREELEELWDSLNDDFRRNIAPVVQDYEVALKQFHEQEDHVQTMDEIKEHFEDFDGDGLATLQEQLRSRREWLPMVVAFVNCVDHMLEMVESSGSEEATERSSRLLRRWSRDYHGVPGQISLVEEVAQEIGELEAAVKKISEFRAKRDEVSLGTAWIGHWNIGSGGQSVAVHLWVKQDVHGCIADRLVVKNVNTKNAAPWTSGEYWWPDVKRCKTKYFKQSIPVEVLANYRLQDKCGSEGMVRLRNWRINHAKRHLRLYQEYCPFGDLGNLIEDGTSNARREQRDWIPEAFIWHVLETIVRVMILCERGRLEDDPISGSLDRPPWGQPWDYIIHRDIKTPNIFLGPPLPDRYRGWPAPKVGDWSLATMIARNDWRTATGDANWWSTVGTRGCKAPEQCAGHQWVGLPSSKSDVFGVGHLAWSLMESRFENDQYPWESEDAAGEIPDNECTEVSPGASRQYSAALVDLVQNCTRYEPRIRPSWADLMQQIQENQQHHVRDAWPADAAFYDPRLSAQRENFALWSPLQDAAAGFQGLPAEFDRLPKPPGEVVAVDSDPPGGEAGADFEPGPGYEELRTDESSVAESEDSSVLRRRGGSEDRARAAGQTPRRGGISPGSAHPSATSGSGGEDDSGDDGDSSRGPSPRCGVEVRPTAGSKTRVDHGGGVEPTAGTATTAEPGAAAPRRRRKRSREEAEREDGGNADSSQSGEVPGQPRRPVSQTGEGAQRSPRRRQPQRKRGRGRQAQVRGDDEEEEEEEEELVGRERRGGGEREGLGSDVVESGGAEAGDGDGGGALVPLVSFSSSSAEEEGEEGEEDGAAPPPGPPPGHTRFQKPDGTYYSEAEWNAKPSDRARRRHGRG